MPLTINRPSVVETTLGITFQIGELAAPQVVGNVLVPNRTVQTYTITNGPNVAPQGAESLTVSSTFVLLDAGTLLNFNGVTATLSNVAPANSTTLQTLPLPGIIQANAEARTKALVFVAGCSNAVVSPQIKNSDITTYVSGLGMEKTTVGNAKTMNLDFNLMYGDRGGAILRKFAFDKAFAGREFYFHLLYPSGEAHEGIALLESASPSNPVQEKRTFSCSAQIQGDTYNYTPPIPFNFI